MYILPLLISKAVTRVQPVSPSVSRAIEKRDKAIRIMALDGSLAEEELFKKAEAEKEKTRKKSRPGNHIQRYGAIYAGDARLKAAARNLGEERYKAEVAKEKEAKFTKDYDYRYGVIMRQAGRLGASTKWRDERHYWMDVFYFDVALEIERQWKEWQDELELMENAIVID